MFINFQFCRSILHLIYMFNRNRCLILSPFRATSLTSTTTTSTEGKSCLENHVFTENYFEVFLHHRGMIAMVNFRRVVMGYRKNHNSITGPTWKYPRLVIWWSGQGRYYGHCLMCPCVFLLNFHRFSEFVDYVLGKDLRYDDEHWSPYFKECTPCHINFTFVGQSLLFPFAAVTVFGFRPLWDSFLGSSPLGKQDWPPSMGWQESKRYHL